MLKFIAKYLFVYSGFVCFAVITSVISCFAAPSIKPHLLEPEAYSETYGFVFSMDESTHLVVQLSVSNLGLGDQNGMCRILYLNGAKSWSVDALYDSEMWRFIPPGFLEMGTCNMNLTDDSLELSAEFSEFRFKAVLHATVKAISPPDHLIKTSDGFFDQQILVRWGKAKVSVEMENQPRVTSAGYGCMYRFWVTALPPDLAQRWIKVFGLDQGGADLLVVRYPSKKDQPIGWNWFSRAQSPTPIMGLDYDGKVIEVDTVAGQYLITLTRQLDRHAPVENIGFWSFVIESWIGNPVTYTYLATIQSPSSDQLKTVLVEVMEDEAD